MAYFELLDDQDVDQIVTVEGETIVIGRDEACDLCLSHERIAPRHALLRRTTRGALIKVIEGDASLTINGEQRQSAVLESGDVICIGPYKLCYREGSPEPEVLQELSSQAIAEAVSRLEGGDLSRTGLIFAVTALIDASWSPTTLISRFGEMLVSLFRPLRCFVEVGGMRWDHDEADREGRGQAFGQLSPIVEQRVRLDGEALRFEEADRPLPRPDEDASPNASDQPDEGAPPRRATILGVRTFMAAPIIADAAPVGVILLERRRCVESNPNEDDLLILISLARLMGVAHKRSLSSMRKSMTDGVSRGDDGGYIVGSSPAMVELRQAIEKRAGPASAPLLLEGEPGVGKTKIAEVIHRASPLRDGPFITIRGAAARRELSSRGPAAAVWVSGQIEAASGGTLFLDDVGELPPKTQETLLTIIRQRRFSWVRGSSAIEVKLKVIAATSRDLREDVAAGRFRADLYEALAGLRLQVPPLRERPNDVAELARCLLARICRDVGRPLPEISGEAMTLLEGYSWPGNVRELANCLERAVILGELGRPLRSTDLPLDLRQTGETQQDLDPLERTEREMIVEALDRTGGNRRQAADLLGWYPQKFYTRLKKYDIYRPKWERADEEPGDP